MKIAKIKKIRDPYASTKRSVERLYNQYLAYKKLIIAFDFDSTLYGWENPDAHVFPKAIALAKKCNELGFYVTIFTASAPDRYDMMREYCQSFGIKVDSINENPTKLPFGHHGKIFYNLLLDDRAGLGQAIKTLTQVIKRIENK